MGIKYMRLEIFDNIWLKLYSSHMSNCQRSIMSYHQEYQQWQLVENILHDFYKLLGNNHSKAKYEIHNILERFLTSHSNYLSQQGVKGRGRLTSELPHVKKMIEELFQKRKLFRRGHQLKKTDLRFRVDSSLIRVWNVKKDMEIEDDGLNDPIQFDRDFVKFGQVFQKIAPDILLKLQQGIIGKGEEERDEDADADADADEDAGDEGDDDEDVGSVGGWSEMDLKLVILRYKANLLGSQQWGMPDAVYDHLYSEFGARFEAFASPLNSRFLGKEGGHFCSIFPETDRVFGSLGNFFDCSLLEPLGDEGSEEAKKEQEDKVVVWSINPPYIESIMEDVFRKVFRATEEALKSGKKLVVFGVIPAWYDSRAFLNLKSFHGLKHLEILKSGGHFYESYKKIVARFESVVYVIDSFGKNVKDPRYLTAFQDMKC